LAPLKGEKEYGKEEEGGEGAAGREAEGGAPATSHSAPSAGARVILPLESRARLVAKSLAMYEDWYDLDGGALPAPFFDMMARAAAGGKEKKDAGAAVTSEDAKEEDNEVSGRGNGGSATTTHFKDFVEV
jgi:hypothetical protein